MPIPVWIVLQALNLSMVPVLTLPAAIVLRIVMFAHLRMLLFVWSVNQDLWSAVDSVPLFPAVIVSSSTRPLALALVPMVPTYPLVLVRSVLIKIVTPALVLSATSAGRATTPLELLVWLVSRTASAANLHLHAPNAPKITRLILVVGACRTD